MSGHTPGPWETDGATEKGRRYHEITAVQTPERFYAYGIAHTLDRDQEIGEDEDRANALLLAAAPELVEALEGLLEAEGYTGPERTRVANCCHCSKLRAREPHEDTCPVAVALATLAKAGREVKR